MRFSQDMNGFAEPFVHKRIIGAAKSFITSGFSPTAAAAGFVAGGARERKAAQARARTRSRFPRSIARCRPPNQMIDGICQRPLPGLIGAAQRILPRGATGFEAQFQVTQGAFGMPAMVPEAVSGVTLRCPSGFVLGDDELCYPKAVLRRNSRFRKWNPGARPILTGGERRGIAKAKRSTNKARTALGLAPLK